MLKHYNPPKLTPFHLQPKCITRYSSVSEDVNNRLVDHNNSLSIHGKKACSIETANYINKSITTEV
jgi:hypothetical protein